MVKITYLPYLVNLISDHIKLASTFFLFVCIFVLQNYRKMANNENYEPMQVDAAEENDNDGDIGAAFHQQAEGGLGAANGFHGVGGFIAPGVIPPGNYPRAGDEMPALGRI